MGLTPEDLARQIKEAREKEGKDMPSFNPGGSGMGGKMSPGVAAAVRAATDLAAALMVGGFMGYWIDRWLNTKPLFMIVLIFLGFGAGMLNIYRSQTGQDYKVGFKDDKAKKE